MAAAAGAALLARSLAASGRRGGARCLDNAALSWTLLAQQRQLQPWPPGASGGRHYGSGGGGSLSSLSSSSSLGSGGGSGLCGGGGAAAGEGAGSLLAQALGGAGADLPAEQLGVLSAAQPLEPLAQFLNPFVLGSSVWEMCHSMTGLPWWASIPLTTLALRTALLPLTLKAKSAALNWVLLQNSFQTANRLLEQIDRQQQQQQQPGAAAKDGVGAKAAIQAAVGASAGAGALKKPGKLKLVRMYYRYFRRQHKTTSMCWWTLNAGVQVNLFLVMSVALRQMAAAHWPGLDREGALWLTDLTQPAVLWGSWQCPFGPAGALVPLGMLMLYLKTIEQSPVARSPLVKVLFDCGVLPLFVFSCAVPQATVLYWAGNMVFFYGMQSALQRPAVARLVGLPPVLLPQPQGAKEERERAEQEAADARQLICGSEDDGFLRFLAASYLGRGLHQQALQCLQRLTELAPGDPQAFSSLGRTASELQQWPAAAAAHERAAELHAALGEADEQATELVLAGKHWLNAVAEARHVQQQQQQQQQAGMAKDGAGAAQAAGAGAMAAGGATGPAADGAEAAPTTTPAADGAEAQKQYIASALAALQAAVALQVPAAGEGWYLMAMAHAAAGQPDDALSAGRTYWERARAAADQEGDRLATSNAAAKLLPVLANLCKRYVKQGAAEEAKLLGAAGMALEVAGSGWDRQSQEALHDALGAASDAAAAAGRFAYAEQLRQLQQQLAALVAKQSKIGRTSK